jgi:maleate isomerase
MNSQSLAHRPVEIEMHAPGMLDQPYGAKARIGLLVLSTDPVIERDFHRLVPSDDVGVFTTRIYLETPNSDRTLSALQNEIEAAVKLIIPDTRLDAVVFGCTAASTLIGPKKIEEYVHRGRPGLACTNPATAAIAALRRFGARKIALVTPYTKQMTGNVIKFLTEAELDFTSVRAVGCDTDDAIGSIPASVYVDAIRQSTLSGADAIFISCTVTKALGEIEKIEDETGLPVVASNQAAFWHALTLAGWKTPIHGHGRLLSEMW